MTVARFNEAVRHRLHWRVQAVPNAFLDKRAMPKVAADCSITDKHIRTLHHSRTFVSDLANFFLDESVSAAENLPKAGNGGLHRSRHVRDAGVGGCHLAS